MKTINKIILLLSIVVLTSISHNASAQCPMCKAAVESSIKSGQSNAGKGLNNGILYLLAAPYLLVGALGYFWYRNYRNKSTQEEVNDDIILN